MHVEGGNSRRTVGRGVLTWATLLFVGVVLDLRAIAKPVGYDIVYVRWPREGDDTVFILPQGEDAYRVDPGASLYLLHADGSQRALVECDTCTVQDPMVSFDGEWVYYTKIEDARDMRSPSLLYKMRIGGTADYREVQLTFDDGFDSALHQGNDTTADDLGTHFSIRDMGPAPLPGGKIAFTSNRHASIPFRQGSNFALADAAQFSVMQLYVMDDHDGRLNSAEASNLRQVGYGNLHLVLHPFVLQDGRLAFSNWDNAGGKFQYAMTSLYVSNPDGSNLAALTEPHDHHKNVDHFATQLGDGAIVTGQYYPSYNFGYGHLCRFPLDVPEPAYTSGASQAKNTYNGQRISFRSFDRKDWESLTPHTSPVDCIAPGESGKYSMPAAAPQGDLLVAYSPGGVNHNKRCTKGDHDVLDSGIYLIPDATSRVVTDPRDSSQLVKVLNSPKYNEIWPRPVVAYEEIHGQKEPRSIPWTSSMEPADDRLRPVEPAALTGTSSLYNRESAPRRGDPFRPLNGRGQHTGTWMVQGTDAGVVKNSDIHAVRIIGVVPKPFRRPIDVHAAATKAEHAAVSHLLHDQRATRFVEGYASSHSERWKIIAEIPVRKTDSSGNPLIDALGDPDTSFVAKVPANTPFFFQGIDRNGMTLFSELTWRAAVPGEVRTDCGGCHAHSIPHLEFSGTAAGKRVPIRTNGLGASDPMIADGVWDVTERTPLITSGGGGAPTLKVIEEGMVGVEFHRDVKPILTRRCITCHSTDDNHSGTDLAFDGTRITDDAYFRIVQDDEGRFGGRPPGGSYNYPQLTRYVRANQARQSLLVWKLLGARLDGRQNSDRDDDLDFTPHSAPHGATLEEARTIARWIDLGCPIDFLSPAHAGYRYTDDNLLPVINIGSPAAGLNDSFDGLLRFGIQDAESGADWSSLEVLFDPDLANGVDPNPVSLAGLSHAASSVVASLPLPGPFPPARDMLVLVNMRDHAGNWNRRSHRFYVSRPPSGPPPPSGSPPPGGTPGDPGVDPLVIDNGRPGARSEGKWTVSTTFGAFGASSLFSNVPGAAFTWTASLPSPGSYAVYAWWTSVSKRSSEAPYTVSHVRGSSVVKVDQTRNGSQWNLLGTFAFGASATVRLAYPGTGPGVCADAVRFVASEAEVEAENEPPRTEVTSITPNPAAVGAPVVFAGTGQDPDGRVTAYEWRSSLAGILSTSATFTSSTLAAGTHTVSLRVKDDRGMWSEKVERTLLVNGAGSSTERIVLENGAAGTTRTGKWISSKAGSPHGGWSLSASGSGSYVFRIPIEAPAKYHVHIWWSDSASHSTKVPIDIQYSGGTKTTFVNQRSKGGRWYALGTYSFNTSVTVTIRVVGKDTTCADAVSLLPAGGTTLPPPPRREGIILDNGGKGTSSTGKWQVSGAPNPYGRDSLSASKGATYTFTIPAAGAYRVYSWWTATPNQTAAVPITIRHAGGTKLVTVNQKKDGGRWNLLGTFTFTKNAVIKITAPGDRTACADAVGRVPVNGGRGS